MQFLTFLWTLLSFSAAADAAALSTPSAPDSAVSTAPPTIGNAPPALPTIITDADKPKAKPGGSCQDAFTAKDTILTFDTLRQYCFRVCSDFVTQSITYDRGSGWADYRETTQPIFYPNADAWSVLNCSAVPSKPEGQACGSNPPGNAKALLSGGSSPYDPNRAPRLGTLEFAKSFLLFDLKSLYVTPIVTDITIYTNVKVHIKGLAKDGRVATHTATVLANFRHVVTVPGDFTKLSALDIWIEKPGSTTKYPFAIDDISIVEYVPVEKPLSCYATSTFPAAPKGPCKPKPTATKTWTVNFDSIPTQTQLPIRFRDIDWANEYYRVSNSSTDPLMYDEPVGPPSPPSQRNYLVNSGQYVAMLSSTLDERFGLKEVSVLCRFPVYQEGDPNGTNGKPCMVTFVGRRDKYDGSGLPEQVRGTYLIPNPNITDGRPRKFTKIKLDQLTKQPGGFSRLFRLDIFTEFEAINYNQYAEAAFDDFVFTRPIGEGTKCRLPGVKTLSFDDLQSNAPMPLIHNGFKFAPIEGWSKVGLVNSYPAAAPATSKPNALLSNSSTYSSSIDSFRDSNPANRTLFDFESITITANVTDPARISALRLRFVAEDACGINSYRVQEWIYGSQSIMAAYYESVMQMGGVQLKFARPFYAISVVRFQLYYDYNSGYGAEPVSFWVDDLRYRLNKSPIPACKRCGYRAAGLCEVPRIAR